MNAIKFNVLTQFWDNISVKPSNPNHQRMRVKITKKRCDLVLLSVIVHLFYIRQSDYSCSVSSFSNIACNLKKCFFVLVILEGHMLCHAQRTNNPLAAESLFSKQVVQSPSTSSLMRNILYPVDYSTGLPEIKIPLYEVNDGDITLPIYLTYHASGIKISDSPGWMGQGWTLVAEPMITRNIKGQDDVYKNLTCDFDKDRFRGNGQYLYLLATGDADEQPDEFYYSLPKKKGMFMYVMEPVDTTLKFMSLPYENIKIERAGKSFHITDDDGTIYKFDGGSEWSGQGLNTIGWRASSIVSSNRKDSLLFIYDSSSTNIYNVKVHNDYMVVIDQFSRRTTGHLHNNRGFYYPQLSSYATAGPEIKDYYGNLPDEFMQSPIVYSTVNNKTKSYQRNDDGMLVSDWFDYYVSNSSPTILTRSQPVREIHFSGGKVVFTQEATNKPRLKEITIYASNGNVVKRIRFNYKDIHERYYLENIEITGAQSVSKEKYQFSYHSPWLPDTGSKAIDYWGYYNGVYRADTMTLVPRQTIDAEKEIMENTVFVNHTVDLNIGSPLSREADVKYMMYGTLSSITYPTGSTDEFTYEAHKYKDEEDSVRIAGGLRIKQIKTLSRGEVKKIRTFKYGMNEDGIGKSLRPLNFEDFMLDQTKYYVDVLGWYGDVLVIAVNVRLTARCRTFFCNPLFDLNYDGGSPVMYDFVTEYEGNSESNSGKTIYEYDIMDWIEEHIALTTISGNRHRGWQHGHLKSKTIYKNESGQYTRIERMDNTFSCEEKNYGKIIVGEAFHLYSYRPGQDGHIPSDQMYGNTMYLQTCIDVKAKLLMSTVNTSYTDNKIVQKSTKYEYSDPHHVFATKITEDMNDGHSVTTLTYPYDYRTKFPYTEMLQRNIVNPTVSKDYTYGDENYRIEMPYSSPYPNIYQPGGLMMRNSTAAPLEPRFTYQYDDRGKIRQKTKDQMESVVYLWGYNHQSIIAQISNATYAEIVAKIFGGETHLESIASSNTLNEFQLKSINDLRILLPNAQVTTYTYEPLVGVKTITDPRGVMTYYDYDDLGRLKGTSTINNNRKKKMEQYDYHYVNP